jgi:hypothetical protein
MASSPATSIEWNSNTAKQISTMSPQTEAGEYIQAPQIRDRRALHESTRILSALPHEPERRALMREPDRMDLDPREVEAWQSLQRELAQVQTDSGYSVEAGTKEGFLRALRDDKHDYFVFVAHTSDGVIPFPNGETLSMEEMKAVSRAVAPQRTLVLISCNAGEVNGASSSPAEIVLSNKLAVNVIAPPEPVSALVVPGMLRDFLIGRKTIGEAFSRWGDFLTQDERLNQTPQPGPEIAELVPRW